MRIKTPPANVMAGCHALLAPYASGMTPDDLLRALTAYQPNPIAPPVTTGPDRYLSPNEVASRLGVTTRTIWRAVKAGELPIVKVGQRRRGIRESDLARYLARLNASPVAGQT